MHIGGGLLDDAGNNKGNHLTTEKYVGKTVTKSFCATSWWCIAETEQQCWCSLTWEAAEIVDNGTFHLLVTHTHRSGNNIYISPLSRTIDGQSSKAGVLLSVCSSILNSLDTTSYRKIYKNVPICVLRVGSNQAMCSQLLTIQ